MEKRELGRSGLQVSAIGYGCMGLSGSYNAPLPKSEGIRLIQSAYERGVTFFDTAEVYGPFANEELLGEAARSFRDEVVIATKFGFDIDPQTGENRGVCSRPERIRQAVEGSLKRLGVETIRGSQSSAAPSHQAEQDSGKLHSVQARRLNSAPPSLRFFQIAE